MKVGIVTITNGTCNYGNHLQNYALVKSLEQFGIEAETIYDIYNAKYKASIRHRIKNYIISTSGLKIKNHHKALKERAFDLFAQKYLNYTQPVEGYLPENKINEYDYFVAGSDQVWNPLFSISEEHWNFLLLGFAPQNRRISYAASIGIPDIPAEYRNSFKECLSGYKAISVREDAGANIVKDITGREAEVVVDPTLLLNASQWRELAKKPTSINCEQKYILTYFLGGYDEHVTKEIESYAQEGWKIYNLLDETQSKLWALDSANFVYLIDNAELILTDSFHASVFSFILGKPFKVYDRNWHEGNMNSRLETLLSMFHLKRKYAGSGLANDIWEHDYEEGYKQLEIEREKALTFLKKAFI